MTQDRDEPGKTAPEEKPAEAAAATPAEEPIGGISPMEAALDATATHHHRATTALLLSVAALVLASLLIVGGWFAWHKVQPMLQAETSEEQQLEQRLAGLESRLSDTAAAVNGLATAQPGATGDVQLGPLTQRLEALEAHRDQMRDNPASAQRISELTEENKRLSAEIALLSESLEALRKSSADASTVLRLSERVEVAERAAREANERRQNAQALLLILGQLGEAINRGDSFENELEAALAVAGEDQAVAQAAEILAPHARNGVSTRPVLARRFEALAGDVVRASVLPEGDNWWQLTLKRLASIVTVRRAGGNPEGDGASAVVARAEQALAAGDLSNAVDQVSRLDGAPAATVQPWLEDARARAEVDRALSSLTSHAIAQIASGR